MYDARVTITAAWTNARTTRAPQRRESLVVRAVTLLARKLPSWHRARSAVMQTSACAAIDVGLFQWDSVAGWVGVGVSLFVLEALSGGER
jgi:hypothetical protein